jgi:hypothetical protein
MGRTAPAIEFVACAPVFSKSDFVGTSMVEWEWEPGLRTTVMRERESERQSGTTHVVLSNQSVGLGAYDSQGC